MRIFTIGYEGATISGFLSAPKAAGVSQVIDVRALPQSLPAPGWFTCSPKPAASLAALNPQFDRLLDLRIRIRCAVRN